jgi:serine/threonine protein kinase
MSSILEDEYGSYSHHLGKGGYGTVDAYKKDDLTVAVKKYKLKKKNVLDACLREITSLLCLQKHPNIVKIFGVFKDMVSLNIILECVAEKLPLDIEACDIPLYFYQMVRAVDFCHKNKIWQRDITPMNFLVYKRSVIKVVMIDFSMACFANCIDDCHSEGITTSWYRAPEVYQGNQYNEKVDVWGLGCVLAEMMFGEALFASNDENKIFDDICETIPKLEQLFSHHPYEEPAMTLLKKILVIDPMRRLPVREILNDPYLTEAKIIVEETYPYEEKSIEYVENDFTSLNDTFVHIRTVIEKEKCNRATWYSTLYIYRQIAPLDIGESFKAPLALLLASAHHDTLPLLPENILHLLTEEDLNTLEDNSPSSVIHLMLDVLHMLDYKLHIYREGFTLIPRF